MRQRKTSPKIRQSSKDIVLLSLVALAVLSVFSMSLFSSLFGFAYGIDQYKKEFAKAEMRIDEQAAINASMNVIAFFQGEASLDPAFFSGSEMSHLEDVRVLLQKARMIYVSSIVLFWSIVLCVFFFRRIEFPAFLTHVCLFSGILMVAVMVIFGALLLMDFDIVFIGFHKIFFTGNYAFDPAVSNMKAIYSDAFFMDAAAGIMVASLAKGVMAFVAGILLRKKIGR